MTDYARLYSSNLYYQFTVATETNSTELNYIKYKSVYVGKILKAKCKSSVFFIYM